MRALLRATDYNSRLNITSHQSHILQAPARILDVTPQRIHKRTSMVLGSPREVEHAVRHLHRV